MLTKVHISEVSGIGEARRRGIDYAHDAGFDELITGRVAVAVSEVATNLLHHAHGGDVLLTVEPPNSGVLSILALDRGPGIASMSDALRDGFSSRKTPGNGLGAVRRMSNAFDIHSQHDAGTAVLAQFCADPKTRLTTSIGAINVPHPNEFVSGDGWTIRQWADRTSILVVDGLGHGPEAAEAAHAAAECFHSRGESPPAAIIEAIHLALRGTRGAAVAVAEVHHEQRLVRFAGVGNIGAGIVVGDTIRHLVSHNGTAGHNVRRVQEFSYPWPEKAVLVLHSDGLGTRWDLAKYVGLRERHPMLVAGVLYRDFSRARDDATVVVLRDRV